MTKRSKSPLSEARQLTPLLYKKADGIRNYVEIGVKFIPKRIIRSAWEFSMETEHLVIPDEYIEKFGANYPRGLTEVFWNEDTRDYLFQFEKVGDTAFNNVIKAITLTAECVGSLVEDILESSDDYYYNTDIFELAYSKLVEKLKSDKIWLCGGLISTGASDKAHKRK